ncbi:hypothetical protein ACFV27_00795 [Streptomyces antimycoticus]|uniref:hypothetical protein n=1 Tax=Streptomyces antimycoticus TaxID=68175 RepID=UPI003677510B
MAVTPIYGVTARRGEELGRCEDAVSVPELTTLVATYAETFANDGAIRIEIEIIPAA